MTPADFWREYPARLAADSGTEKSCRAGGHHSFRAEAAQARLKITLRALAFLVSAFAPIVTKRLSKSTSSQRTRRASFSLAPVNAREIEFGSSAFFVTLCTQSRRSCFTAFGARRDVWVERSV